MSADKLIQGPQIKDATVDASAKLIDGSVTKAKMAAGSVGSTQLENASVTDAKIVGMSGSKLTDATVTEAKLSVAVQSKLNNPDISGIEAGDIFSLLSYTDNVKYSESTSDLYKQVTPTNNFWHPSYSIAGFSTGVQSIGYGATVDTTLVSTTNKQFYFAVDLAISGSSNCKNNAAGMYFVFNMPFRGMIWVGGVEVFNNLDLSDTALIYTTKFGPHIVNLPNAQENLTVGSTNRIAILYKQESGQSSLVFKVGFGTSIGGAVIAGPDSVAIQASMDTILQGTAYIKISAAEYATLPYIPTSAEKTFLTTTKADAASYGGIVYNDNLTSYVQTATLAATGGAAMVGFDDTGFGFIAYTVQEAIRKVVDNISGVITFDNTIPALPGLTATPTIQEGINKLAYAANLHIDGTQWSGVLAPSALYIQNALDKLRDAANIRFNNTGVGILTSPADVQAAIAGVAVPNNVPFTYPTKLTATTLGEAIRELRDRFDNANNVAYNGALVGIPATEVKTALDYIVAHLPASNEFLYNQAYPWTTIKTNFAKLGITVPSDVDITSIVLDNAISYLYQAGSVLEASNELISATKTMDEYYIAGPAALSNDFTFPSSSTKASINAFIKSSGAWYKIEAFYKTSTGKFDEAYYDSAAGSEISNDLTSCAIPVEAGSISISKVTEAIRVLGAITATQKALIKVDFT